MIQRRHGNTLAMFRAFNRFEEPFVLLLMLTLRFLSADRTSSNGLIQAVMFSSAFVLIVILALYSSLMRKG